MLAGRPSIFEMSFELGGGERTRRQLLLPPGTDILIFARERGVDVRLEVMRDGKIAALSDSPIFRTGTQRATFAAVPGATYAINLVAKEYTNSRGHVDVRAVALQTGEAADACIGLQRSLAAADSQFATGQLVTLGLRASSETDAAAAYAASAKGYAGVAETLAAADSSALLAETQHAAAAALYWGVQDWEASCAAADRAMRTYRSIGAAYGVAKTQALLAAALMETAPSTKLDCGADARLKPESRTQRIRRLLTSAAATHEKRGEPYDQALALNDLGLASQMADDYRNAFPAFERALTLYEQTRETQKQAQVLQNIAWTDYGLGRLSAALPLYSRALALLQPKQDPTLYAAILNNSALANTAAGNYDTALQQLSESLDLIRISQDKWWEVTILDNIGRVYDRTGATDLALDFYTQALAMADASRISSGRRTILSKMATIFREKGEYVRAIAVRKEALSLAQSPSSIVSTTIELAADQRAGGNLEQADELLHSILSKPQIAIGDFNRAVALQERGYVAAARHMSGQAESDYRKARNLFHALDVPQREFSASLALAQSLAARSSSQAALDELSRTLQLAEQIRLQSANPELRARLLATSRPAFDLKISLLAARYFANPQAANASSLALDALLVAEQARARALLDFRRLDMTAADTSPRLLQIRQSLYAELSARRQRLESLLETATTEDPEIVAVRSDIAELRQRLTDVESRLAASSLRSAGTETPWAIDLQAIPEDAGIVEYWIGQTHALAWSITRERISLIDLGSASTIADAALALHIALREGRSGTEQLQLAQRAYQRIFAPLAASVSDKIALIFIADGALHYVPFAALNDRTRFLAQDHDLAIAPSLRSLFEARPAPPEAASRMLLVSDPVYEAHDARLPASRVLRTTNARPGTERLQLFRGAANDRTLQRLPGTAAEAAAIRTLFRPGQIDTLEGAAASRERFLATDFSGYRFIHIASHAVADPDIPQLSALILSTVDGNGRPIDGRVLAADAMNLRFNTEILVLSGCETALGKSIEGEGLIGLQYVMLARGTRSVLSSLWQVSDRKTAELMSLFYGALLRQERNPRQALGNAMRSLIAEGADPSLWSAFSLTTTELDLHRSQASITNHLEHRGRAR